MVICCFCLNFLGYLTSHLVAKKMSKNIYSIQFHEWKTLGTRKVLGRFFLRSSPYRELVRKFANLSPPWAHVPCLSSFPPPFCAPIPGKKFCWWFPDLGKGKFHVRVTRTRWYCTRRQWRGYELVETVFCFIFETSKQCTVRGDHR